MKKKYEVVKIYKKILFATDGSPHSDNVAKQIVEFQKEWNCKIVVFHSLKHNNYLSIVHSDKYLLSMDYRSNNELRKELGKEILKQTKKIFDRANISVETRLIEDEGPEDYIKRRVEKEEFDLVVLGFNGHHSKSQKSFLGTRSIKILKHAPCDVLIIR